MQTFRQRGALIVRGAFRVPAMFSTASFPAGDDLPGDVFSNFLPKVDAENALKIYADVAEMVRFTSVDRSLLMGVWLGAQCELGSDRPSAPPELG